MALKTLLSQWLASESVVYECRTCGTTLDADDETCPACGSDDIVKYEFE